MKLFHTNPGGWKEKYILNNKYYKSSPAAIVGTMAHAVVAGYMEGRTIQECQAEQLEKFNAMPDEGIKWGKTGSRQKVQADFTQAVQMFFDEMPDYTNVLGIEKELQHTVSDTIDGVTLICPLPFKGYLDLIFEENGDIIIEDFKFKIAHTTDEEGPHPQYWTQACFYYYLVRQEYGREPKECRFREVKISKSKSGGSQHNVITLNFQSEDFQMQKSFFWYQLNGMMKNIEDLDADSFLIYNTFDMMTGREAFDMMLKTQFGYAADKAIPTDLVKVNREEIKTARFIEEKAPDSIEGKIKFKFQEFGIALQFAEKVEGHAFDRYLFTPSRGVTMASVKRYSEDVSLATQMDNIRIVAPVPGTGFVGVEVPRVERKFEKYTKDLGMPIGKDIDGQVYTFSLADSNTPHMLVAGRTGSGKSEFLKVMIEGRPAHTDLVIIDPKRVELTKYKKDCLLYGTTMKQAVEILEELQTEMNTRYEKMERLEVTNVEDTAMNRIMCVIEEFASLRLGGEGGHIEDLIENLTNMGRAAGIHLIIATQRPDVKVVSGRIKANIGCRVCFATASVTDSEVILDSKGAEKLSGKGDMLFLYPGKELVRLQSFYL